MTCLWQYHPSNSVSARWRNHLGETQEVIARHENKFHVLDVPMDVSRARFPLDVKLDLVIRTLASPVSDDASQEEALLLNETQGSRKNSLVRCHVAVLLQNI